jgi:cell division septation protein DedD
MEPALKQRLIGAVVISALAIYFLPKLIVGHDKNSPAADVSLQVPGAPDHDFETRELPLTGPTGTTPPGGVVGMDTSGKPPAVVLPATSSSAGPNAPAVVVPAGATPAANGVAPPVAALPTTQGALPTTPTGASPVATTPGAATPATAAPSGPIPAASAGGNYVVSAGTYSNAANAQSLVNSLKAAQLPAYMENVNANGKPGTRVRIGPYAQRGDAEAARLHAQQVRTDMTASVTALDAAVEAPAAKPAAAAAPAVAKPAASKPAATSPPSASPPAASTPVTPTPVASNGATAKPVVPASNAVAAKPAAAAPASPAAAGRGYVVQVSAFRTEEEALALRNRLRAAGFNTFSEPVKTDSGTLYRVRVGPAADRDAADQLRLAVSQKTGLSGVVMAYP